MKIVRTKSFTTEDTEHTEHIINKDMFTKDTKKNITKDTKKNITKDTKKNFKYRPAAERAFRHELRTENRKKENS